MPEFLRFSETLASRMCHDLIAPIGAIHTGLELLSQTLPAHLTEFNEILNLILQSTDTASSRASFFRAAFGTGGHALSLEDIKKIATHYLAHTKLDMSWHPCENPDLLKGWGGLLLNVILWIHDSAPQGGVLTLSFPNHTSLILNFNLKADQLVFHQGTLEILEGGELPENLTPRTVPCYLIRALLEEKKGTFSLDKNVSGGGMRVEIKA